MLLSDPIADMLVRIRNAQKALHKDVEFPASGMKEAIANILKEHGYIQDYSAKNGKIQILLKYHASKGSITGSRKVSKPGLRVYVSSLDIPAVQNGLGIAILSTSRGLLEGQRAKNENVGGELLCEIW